jgi:hypothetical protein
MVSLSANMLNTLSPYELAIEDRSIFQDKFFSPFLLCEKFSRNGIEDLSIFSFGATRKTGAGKNKNGPSGSAHSQNGIQGKTPTDQTRQVRPSLRGGCAH